MGALSRMPGWARAAITFAVALTASTAGAQNTSDKRIPGTDADPHANGDGMDTHLFRPALDSKGFFSVNGSDILGANNISFGLILDYGRNIMRLNEDRVACGAAGQPVCPGNDPAATSLGA